MKFKTCHVRKNAIDHQGELKLAQVKNTWDPELVFSCRHCIGDGKAAAAMVLALSKLERLEFGHKSETALTSQLRNSGEMAGVASEKTLPTWRRPNRNL